MKACHVASLALVGWYLLSPPLTYEANIVNVKAPLTEWDQIAAFDSAAKCQAALFYRIDAALNRTDDLKAKDRRRGMVWDSSEGRALTQGSRCVSTDDPRLKAN